MTSAEYGGRYSLYEFKMNDKTWRYTNARTALNMLGVTWLPITISDSGARQKGDVQADTFEITCQSDIPFVRFFMSDPPTAELTLTARRFFPGETETEVYFVGAVTNTNVPTIGHAILSCTAISASLEREGLRLTWGRTCPYAVYDRDCRVFSGDFEVSGVVATSENGVITVPQAAGYLDNWFSGGSIQWNDAERGIERRGIESQIGQELTVFGVSTGIKPGLTVVLLPGCNRTLDHCRNKFNNVPNYGGIPNMPNKSPFGSDPIF